MNRPTWLQLDGVLPLGSAVFLGSALLLGSAVFFGACSKQEEAPAAQTDAPTTLTDAALDEADVPVKEDFEEQAYAAINEDNVEAQVDALEQEISRDAE